jgi:hypothetical protein
LARGTYKVPGAERIPTGSAPRVNQCRNESFSLHARHQPISRASEKPKNTSRS